MSLHRIALFGQSSYNEWALSAAELGAAAERPLCGRARDSLFAGRRGRLALEWTAMALTEIDRNLLTRCLNREPDAWKDFVDRFMGLVVHVVNHTGHARSIRLTPDDVDDLCADVFLGIIAKDFAVLRHFRQQSSLATYLAVVARRICVRQLARRKLAERLGHTLAHRSQVPEALTSNPEQLRIDDAEQIERMIEGLGPVEARVVRLFHLENKSYAQIGAELDIPENSVGPILSRARAHLRSNRARESQQTTT